MTEIKPNTGLSDEAREKITKDLAVYLADSYVLYVKTQVFHWNVTGPEFGALHKVFEMQYEALAEAVDELAERIRSLGSLTPKGMSAMLELATLSEAGSESSPADMVKTLLEDNEALIRNGNALIDLAGEAGDNATADILTQRVSYHEKTSWMLRSSL